MSAALPAVNLNTYFQHPQARVLEIFLPNEERLNAILTNLNQLNTDGHEQLVIKVEPGEEGTPLRLYPATAPFNYTMEVAALRGAESLCFFMDQFFSATFKAKRYVRLQTAENILSSCTKWMKQEFSLRVAAPLVQAIWKYQSKFLKSASPSVLYMCKDGVVKESSMFHTFATKAVGGNSKAMDDFSLKMGCYVIDCSQLSVQQKQDELKAFKQSEINRPTLSYLYETTAYEGHAESQYEFALLVKEPKLRIRFLGKAAMQGHTEAQYKLGLMKEGEEGICWLEEAAKQDHVEAQFELALRYHTKGVFKRAQIFFQKAARHGHKKANDYLGNYFLYGYGSFVDLDKAIECFRRAGSQKELAEALYEKGWQFCYKKGAARQMLDFFEESANLGNPRAQCELAVALWEGRGGDKNPARALPLFERAAAQEDPRAQYLLWRVKESKDKQLLLAAAKNNHHIAQYELGKLEKGANGRGWMERSAKGGFAEAQNAFADMLRDKPAEAKEWLERAALQNYRPAQIKLETLLIPKEAAEKKEKREKGRKEIEQLNKYLTWDDLDWLKEAAQRKDPEAQLQLGLCYWHGRDVPQDRKLARAWIERAVDQGHKVARLWLAQSYWSLGVNEIDLTKAKALMSGGDLGFAIPTLAEKKEVSPSKFVRQIEEGDTFSHRGITYQICRTRADGACGLHALLGQKREGLYAHEGEDVRALYCAVFRQRYGDFEEGISNCLIRLLTDFRSPRGDGYSQSIFNQVPHLIQELEENHARIDNEQNQLNEQQERVFQQIVENHPDIVQRLQQEPAMPLEELKNDPIKRKNFFRGRLNVLMGLLVGAPLEQLREIGNRQEDCRRRHGELDLGFVRRDPVKEAYLTACQNRDYYFSNEELGVAAYLFDRSLTLFAHSRDDQVHEEPDIYNVNAAFPQVYILHKGNHYSRCLCNR